MHIQIRESRTDPVTASPVDEHPSEGAEASVSIILHVCLPCSCINLETFVRLQFLPFPTSPGLDAAVSQSLGICVATCGHGGDHVTFYFTVVNTEPFVWNSWEVWSLMPSVSLLQDRRCLGGSCNCRGEVKCKINWLTSNP